MYGGERYEAQALCLLERSGMKVLERNYRCKLGEIDIICTRGRQLVFVEVRCRKNSRYASAAASITIAKQRKLVRTAQYYLQRKGWSNKRPCRFDVVTFSTPQSPDEDGIQWLQNAFTM